ncbi:hypothetical protein [Streptomyces gobiensis]|uniref:hypothetical protein n=1 Tax=Streptomyces gobiensis TaxID=2875706 RepID=UPI001E53D5A7|nr:hypothetical protein [Streptomyces gobiensis]UGY91242.1 hypothetical protein test1122_05595 [Streptomyces gobiensis]
MTSPSSADTRTGWWCQVITYASDIDGASARVQSRVALTPERALVCLRIAVRVLLHGFDPKDFQRAFWWLEHG